MSLSNTKKEALAHKALSTPAGWEVLVRSMQKPVAIAVGYKLGFLPKQTEESAVVYDTWTSGVVSVRTPHEHLRNPVGGRVHGLLERIQVKAVDGLSSGLIERWMERWPTCKVNPCTVEGLQQFLEPEPPGRLLVNALTYARLLKSNAASPKETFVRLQSLFLVHPMTVLRQIPPDTVFFIPKDSEFSCGPVQVTATLSGHIEDLTDLEGYFEISFEATMPVYGAPSEVGWFTLTP